MKELLRDITHDLGRTIAFLGIVSFMVYMLAGAFVMASTESQCLRMGYPDSSVDYAFRRYCIELDTDETGRVQSRSVEFKSATHRR